MSNELNVFQQETDQLIVESYISELEVTLETQEILEVTITDVFENSLNLDYSINVLQVMQGDIYFADNELIPPAMVSKNVFNVITNDTRVFNLPADARILLHVMINQIDYEPYCSINPIGSGQVVYTPGVNGYLTEIGDRVTIYWQR
jgi:hypothetical protein